MKGKCCPNCKKWNKPSDIICPECGEDLLRVKLQEIKEDSAGELQKEFSSEELHEEISAEKIKEENQNESSQTGEESMVYARICRVCSRAWPYSESKCCNCGTSLECEIPVLLSPSVLSGSVIPIDSDEVSESPKPLYSFCSDDGFFQTNLSEGDEIILGRESCGAEYMKNKDFVSRMHAKLSVVKGELLITHIGSSNPTLVNGRAIEKDKPFRIQAGDQIALGARERQGYNENIAYFHINRYTDQSTQSG